MQLNSPLYLLMAVAKGQAAAPGRKAVLYFAGGLDVPGQIDSVFKATQSEANRANVSFYAIDVGGLDTWSEGQSSRSALAAVAKTSMEQAEKTSGGTTTAEIHVTEDAEASTRANWKQPLKELSDNTGGVAVLDTTTTGADGPPGRRPRRLLRDHLRPLGRGVGRCFPITDVKVSRGGTKVQHGNGYIATPPDEAGPVLAYEMPLLEALKSPQARQDFPIKAGTFAFGSEFRGAR